MVQFEKESGGYNKQQVDEYLTVLSREYQKLLDELELSEKKQEIMAAEMEQLRAKKEPLVIQSDGQELAGSEFYTEAIVSALVTAEVTAKQVVGEAKTKAGLITDTASKELDRIEQAKEAALQDIRRLSGQLTDMLESLEAFEDPKDLGRFGDFEEQTDGAGEAAVADEADE